MKKTVLMLVVGGLITLTSCSKKDDYTCACVYTSTENGVVLDTSSEDYEYKDEKKEDAEELCESNEYSSSTGFFGITLVTANVCTLN